MENKVIFYGNERKLMGNSRKMRITSLKHVNMLLGLLDKAFERGYLIEDIGK